MVKIATNVQERFCQSDHPECHAILLYGPDEGRIRERVRHLLKAVVSSTDDPFLISKLNAEAKGEANQGASAERLSDEALQLSLMGGRRLVLVENASDKQVPAIQTLLKESLPLPALVICQAGDLSPRAKLRQLFEKEKSLAAVATYKDDQRSLADAVQDWSRETGLRLSREAQAFLTHSLGNDRALSRQELNKLALYCLDQPQDRMIERADVEAILVGQSNLDVDEALFAALSGQLDKALVELHKALAQGKTVESLVATYLFHVHRLIDAQALVLKGVSPREATEAMRPPIFFTKRTAFTQQVQKLARSPLLQQIYASTLELQAQARASRDQSTTLIERYLMRTASLTS